MRNLTSGYQEILVVVISLVLATVEIVSWTCFRGWNGESVCVCVLGKGGFRGGDGLVSLDYVVESMLVVLMSFSLVKPSYIASGK